MKEKKDPKINELPPETFIKIFSNKTLNVQDLLGISIVCKKWSGLAIDNKIWEPVFIKRFSFLPKINESKNFYNKSYKRQLQLIEKYKHHKENYSANKPSLLQKSIETRDISLTQALLETKHKIVVNTFGVDGDGGSLNNNFFAFIAKCTYLLTF